MKRIFLNILVLIFILIDITLLVVSQQIPYDKPDYKKNDEKSETTVIRIAKKNNFPTSKFAELVEEFNETNQDNIKVEILGISNENYHTELNYLMTSSLEPDIMNVDSDWIRTFIDRKWLIDLQPFIKENILGSETRQMINYLKDYSINDSIYVLPTSLVTYRLLYNGKIFDKNQLDKSSGPNTFLELVTHAEKISKTGKEKNIYGFILPLKNRAEGFKKSLEVPGTISGINYYDVTTKKVDFTVYKDWFLQIRSMINNNTLFPGYENVDMNLALNQFAEENVGMLYVSSEDCPTIRSLYRPGYDWRFSLPPVYDDKGANHELMMTYGNYYAISKATKNLEKTLVVWNYLNSSEFNKALFFSGESIPIEFRTPTKEWDEVYNPIIKSFLPTKEEAIYPVFAPEAENLHRMNSYIDCLSSQEEIIAILKKENYYVRNNSLR